VKHVEASLSFLPLDEVEVFQLCSPLSHDVEEVISLNDEEFEDPVENVYASTPLAHKHKEMIICVDGLMREPLDMVDAHINTFIETGRHKWDLDRPIFDRPYLQH
jgi:hypothetical protein